METVLEPKENNESQSSLMNTAQGKAISAQAVPLEYGNKTVKVQTSAPSYFHSLKDNDAPPFKKPDRETRPRLLVRTLMTEDDAIDMIAASDADREEGLQNYLARFLVENKVLQNYNISEKRFLISFLTEGIDYAAQREFSARKLACLLTVYISAHVYFKRCYWLSPESVWVYFKEIMIRHTIEDSPDGEEFFKPDECYDIISHFHTLYISNLPLIHILVFGASRIKFVWPFKVK